MTLVCVHGASGNAASWGSFGADIAGVPVVCPDLPGRGSTPGPACQTVAEAAARLARDLTARGLVKPVVVGHSFGGAIALQLALDHPDVAGGLVLVSSASRLRVHPAILAAAAAATPSSAFRVDAAFGPGTSPEVIDAYAALTASVPPATVLADWTACDAFDVRDRLSEVRLPVLIVHGDADALTIPKHQRALEHALPNARRVEVAGAGHMLPWEAPDALAIAVTDWLRAASADR